MWRYKGSKGTDMYPIHEARKKIDSRRSSGGSQRARLRFLKMCLKWKIGIFENSHN